MIVLAGVSDRSCGRDLLSAFRHSFVNSMNSEPVDILMDMMGWIFTVLVITARPMFLVLFRRLLFFLSLSPQQTGYSQVASTDLMERILPSTYVTVLCM